MQIPDLHSKAVAEAHDNHIRLVRKLAEHERTVAVAEAGHKAALAGDRDALAAAMREGKPEPKPSAGKAEAALKDATLRLEAARQAVAEAERAVADVIEAGLAALKAQGNQRVEVKRKTFRAALDALAVANAELAVEEAAMQWLGAWPDGKLGGGRRILADLPAARNGDPLGVPEVLDALRKRGLPPEPYRPPGALRVVEPGTVLAPSQPMLESMARPEVA
jgi:hypothetical protein